MALPVNCGIYLMLSRIKYDILNIDREWIKEIITSIYNMSV